MCSCDALRRLFIILCLYIIFMMYSQIMYSIVRQKLISTNKHINKYCNCDSHMYHSTRDVPHFRFDMLRISPHANQKFNFQCNTDALSANSLLVCLTKICCEKYFISKIADSLQITLYSLSDRLPLSYPSICLSICCSTALLLDLGNFFSFLIPYTVGSAHRKVVTYTPNNARKFWLCWHKALAFVLRRIIWQNFTNVSEESLTFFTLKMKVTVSSEVILTFYQIKQSNIPEDKVINSHCHEKLKSTIWAEFLNIN
jgi:hypothetical protein